MVTGSEKTGLMREWQDRPRSPMATVCKCAAGLLLLVALAHFGAAAGGHESALEWTGAQPSALDRPETARQPG